MSGRMTKLQFSQVLGAIMVSAAVSASAADSAGLALEVQNVDPGAQVIEVTSGDLDGDGAADVAALVHRPAPDESFRIVVLRAQGSGLVVWARGANVGPFPKGLPALSIERGSIMFDTSAATCCERSTEHHQFQLRDGRFRLIGAAVREASQGAHEPRAIDDVFNEIDFNLLTGDRVEKLEARGRKAQSRKSREAVPAPRWLENFSGLLDDPDLAQVFTARLHSRSRLRRQRWFQGRLLATSRRSQATAMRQLTSLTPAQGALAAAYGFLTPASGNSGLPTDGQAQRRIHHEISRVS